MTSRCSCGCSDSVISQLVTDKIKKIMQDPRTSLESIIYKTLVTNEDCYAFACRLVPNVDDILPEIKKGAQKCSLTAEILKSEGNNAFRLGQYEKAEELFTLSAAYAVPDQLDGTGKNTLALAIANRSGALFFSGKYKETLIDIESAFRFGYPEDLKYKLYDRKGKCFQSLKAYRAAEEAFQLAATHLDKASLDECRKKDTRAQIEKNIDVCVKNRGKNVDVNLELKGELPKLSDEPNETHPSLTSACEVTYEQGKGRCITAARDIKPGEVLLVEKPFASVFMPDDQLKDCCHHCFYPCLTLLPCLKCTKGRYCSLACRYVAWESYHKYECGFPLGELIGEGSSERLALRIILVAGLERLVELRQKDCVIEDQPKKFRGCNEQGQYLSTDYTSIHLLHVFEIIPKEFHFTLAIKAVVLTKLLEKLGFFDNRSAGQKQYAMACVGECLLEHLIPQFIHTYHNNPLWHEKPDISGKERVGLSVHATKSLFNHSCNIETCESYYGNNVVVYSLQSFKQGQEVTINYGQPFLGSNKETRQKFLRNMSFFECSCECCRDNWPLMDDLSDTPTFKCMKCKAPLQRAKNDLVTCKHCKQVQSLSSKMKSLKSAIELYKTAEHPDTKLQVQLLEAMDKLLVQPWRDYVRCRADLMYKLWQKGSHVNKRQKYHN